MDGCSRQDPAYRSANEKPRASGAFPFAYLADPELGAQPAGAAVGVDAVEFEHVGALLERTARLELERPLSGDAGELAARDRLRTLAQGGADARDGLAAAQADRQDLALALRLAGQRDVQAAVGGRRRRRGAAAGRRGGGRRRRHDRWAGADHVV